MSKLDELIQELCPNGVEYIPIINLAEIGTGSHNTNEELDDGKYPFFVRSQTPRKLNTQTSHIPNQIKSLELPALDANIFVH